MDEFLIIKKYLSKLSKKNKGSFNLSDDIFFDHEKKIGVSIDTYVEKVHFINFQNPDLVIRKVLRATISDLISKGINSKYYFISFSGNKKHFVKKKLDKMLSSLKSEQKKYKICLSGGDTTYSDRLSITICAIGNSKKFPVLRSGAKLNDDIYMTNTVGDANLGLNILKKKVNLDKKNNIYFVNKFYSPDLPIDFSKKIYQFANSSIDISDGLFQDLKHILNNSNFSSELFVDKIPISKKLESYIKKKKLNKLNFVSKGDDYQILFTAKKNKRTLIRNIARKTSTKVTLIGSIKNNSLSGSIKLNILKFKIPKKLGFIHKF